MDGFTHPAKKLLNLLVTNGSAHEMNDAFVDFCIYFNRLTLRFARNPIQDRHVIDIILSKNNFSQPQVFQKHIYAANVTFQRLFKVVFASNIKTHSHIIQTLLFDINPIIAKAEDFEQYGDSLNYGHRDEQIGREIFDAARAIFYIQAVDTSKAYLREISPVSIFMIRQSLEVLGKNVLGFSAIKGRPQRYKNTNVAWSYIQKELTKPTPNILLPIEFSIIWKIIEWTNAYIHTGDLKDYYVIENVLNSLMKLFYALPTALRTPNYAGMLVTFGFIQIQNYNQVKQDFTLYVNSAERFSRWKRFKIWIKWEKAPKQWEVEWIPLKLLKEVTITSL
ncbi:MAG: hypothetical protein JST26_05590 [Bacteroidetes bacterium]|nr:hypothetical protein [Bacteroidota bacterium]